MKKLFKKINNNARRIDLIEGQIENINMSAFYQKFGSEAQRQKDLLEFNETMKAHLDERQVLLENLQIEINKELNKISQAQRACTLLKIA